MSTTTELVPFVSRHPWAQMRPEVSMARGYRAGDAAIDGLGAGFGTSTVGRHHPEGRRSAQMALPMSGESHNRLVQTTQSRSSRG